MLLQKITDINDFLVFVVVTEQGSFTKAAQFFELPKSNISRKISRLEQDLNARLFERTTRSLRLTAIGELVYGHAKRLEEELNSSLNTVQTALSEPQGKLRFCASNTIGIELISPILAEFQVQFPKVQLDFKLANRRVDLIEEGFDFAIRVGEVTDLSLIAKPLYQIHLRLFASPKYLQANPALTQPSDLLNHDCLHMTAVTNKPLWQLINQTEPNALLEEVLFEPKLSCDDFMVIREACLNGSGVALLPHYMASEEMKNGRLERVLPSFEGNSLPLCAVYPSRRGATPKLKAMLNYLSEHFAKKD